MIPFLLLSILSTFKIFKVLEHEFAKTHDVFLEFKMIGIGFFVLFRTWSTVFAVVYFVFAINA